MGRFVHLAILGILNHFALVTKGVFCYRAFLVVSEVVIPLRSSPAHLYHVYELQARVDSCAGTARLIYTRRQRSGVIFNLYKRYPICRDRTSGTRRDPWENAN